MSQRKTTVGKISVPRVPWHEDHPIRTPDNETGRLFTQKSLVPPQPVWLNQLLGPRDNECD